MCGGDAKMRPLRVALAQVNATVGDFGGNVVKILDYLEQARAGGADVVAFPELVIAGYPPEDLLLKPRFVQENRAALRRVATRVKGITAIVGFVDSDGDTYNAAALLHDGEVVGVHHKCYLPNYGVFDEDRYFQAGRSPLVFALNDVTVGVNICEDIWYPGDPIRAQTLLGGAEVIINISASPYHVGKGRFRHQMIATRAADNVCAVAFCNLVGGQDELVFDGHSAIFDPRGVCLVEGKQFEEDLLVADLDAEEVFRMRLHDPRLRKERARGTENNAMTLQRVTLTEPRPPKPPLPAREATAVLPPAAEVYRALVLGTRDYVRKNGFQKVVIGLSGGIDSSLTATVAADALGKENVVGVFMPSQFSSRESREDAEELANRLGIRFIVLPIQNLFECYLQELAPVFENLPRNIAEENLQARVRGNLLMAMSNKFGWLVLTTGNKSETSVGYCTLYGDTAGGFAVIKDVPKTMVYELCAYRNTLSRVIPDRVLVKAPTAELRENQKDTDSLPPYEVLDPILKAYVEEDRSLAQIVEMGWEEETVQRVIRLVDRNEYKRRQAPPGVKITPRAFGKDRRLPIVNAFTDADG
jgi:NAD+ synthase (glutamine-hydrolysing)